MSSPPVSENKKVVGARRKGRGGVSGVVAGLDILGKVIQIHMYVGRVVQGDCC